MLRTPGPSDVPADVRLAEAEPVLHHRSPEFGRLIAGVGEGLSDFLGGRGEVLILAGSGSAAMEASVVNLFAPGDRVLVVDNGFFGDRYARIALAHGLEVHRLAAPWDAPIEPDAVAAALDGHEDVAGVLLVACETSSGILLDVEGIARAASQRGKRVVVDAISVALTSPMSPGAWGVDCLVAASQKGLGCPPGLAIVWIAGFDRLPNPHLPSYYLDLQLRRPDSGGEPPMPFTPPTSLIRAARAAIARIRREGLARFQARHRLASEMVCAAAEAIGLRVIAPAGMRSPSLTVLELPDAIRTAGRMLNDHGVRVAPGLGPTRSAWLRFGHMGFYSPLDIVAGVAALEMSLAGSAGPGPGAAAAMEALRRSGLGEKKA